MVRAQPRQSERRDGRYKGVRMRKWGKWVAEVRQPNSRGRIWLGSYDTAEEAARAHDAAVFCLRGQSAVLNFPGDPPGIPSGEKLSPSQIQVEASKHARKVVAAGELKQPPAAVVENFFFGEASLAEMGSSSFVEFGGGEGYFVDDGRGGGVGGGGAEDGLRGGLFFDTYGSGRNTSEQGTNLDH
ncbi:hypothetical protein CASFOL_013703 [Castilleja foliolosa]|uniref:AP2/ERF domain-containing protein n=1 Tax=Castilleja foliolosa TaxID=1961234 RepID=A0ABD3DLB6_9LAMI